MAQDADAVLDVWSTVAIIQDPDGWTNVRKSPDIEATVIHKVYENEVFFYYDKGEDSTHPDWIKVYLPANIFSMGCGRNGLTEGYIHRSRIKPITELERVTNGEVTFIYQLADFNPKGKMIEQLDTTSIPSTVNGRYAWGTAGNLPRVAVNGITVVIDDRKVPIHRVFYDDLFECTNDDLHVFKNGDTYFVHQWNSDGAGSYELVWVFSGNELKQRLVGNII